MTDSEINDLLRQREGPLYNAWCLFRSESARIEQALEQSKPPSMIEVCRMELEAVEKIREAFAA